LRPVTAMAPTSDGRLLFVEDGRRVRMVADGVLLERPALAVDGEESRLTGLAVDPAVTASRAVFAAVTSRSRDGWESTVIRYRELNHVLGEGAAVIAGLPMPPSHESPIAIDSSGHVYVALPAIEEPSGSRVAYNGFVLKFNGDGTVPVGARGGSPVVAYGYGSPTSLAWSSGSTGGIWLSGADARAASPLARVAAGQGTVAGTDWPAVPLIASIRTGEARNAVVSALAGDPREGIWVASGTRVTRGIPAEKNGGGLSWSSIDLAPSRQIVTIAAGPRSDVYVAVRDASSPDAASFAILHLSPR
jgi:hypothetical protein